MAMAKSTTTPGRDLADFRIQTEGLSLSEKFAEIVEGKAAR
jgi:hypothetical protein